MGGVKQSPMGQPLHNINICLGFYILGHPSLPSFPPCSAMEGMMAINMVEWNNDSIKRAEQACKEAEQIVLIKTIDVSGL